uniref:Protein LTV1 homolog n=1 Tax=Syphacia muris TaxID=451379 RepID=A0A0N5AJV1_9BILA
MTSDKSCEQNGEDGAWCQVSEMRFFKKLMQHKPAGWTRHLQMCQLDDLLNNVYENEDTDFEDILNEEDFNRIVARKGTDINERDPPVYLRFSPRYSIKPTSSQIRAKLDELYNMERIEQNEYEPPFKRHEEEFFLPVQDYGDLLRKKEEVAREQNFITPGASATRKTNRRRRKDSGLVFIDGLL